MSFLNMSVESKEFAKRQAALAAAKLVKKGDIVGLGTGSTSAFVIQELGRRTKKEGLKIQCVPSSADSALLAHDAGLLCLPIEKTAEIDISIDGADEIDPERCLLKGRGGAHTREKLIHAMSKRFVLTADISKKVERLGKLFPCTYRDYTKRPQLFAPSPQKSRRL